MPGLHSQSRRKKEKHAVDMTAPPEEPPRWVRPPASECEEQAYSHTPAGADPANDRVTVRMACLVTTGEMVEFAIVQTTRRGNKWHEVARADSSHEDEVHIHRFGRRGGELGGPPEHLKPVVCAADLADGYDLAYHRIIDNWAENKARWLDG